MKAAIEMALYRAGKSERVHVVADIQFAGHKLIAQDMSAHLFRGSPDAILLTPEEQVRAERALLSEIAIALRSLLDAEERKPRLVTQREKSE